MKKLPNINFIARHIYVEAMRLDPDSNVPDGGFLSPHDVSHASIAGWLLGRDFREFRVMTPNDERQFSIEYVGKDRNRKVVKPGDWLLMTGDGNVVSMTDDEFHRMYDVHDAPEFDNLTFEETRP